CKPSKKRCRCFQGRSRSHKMQPFRSLRNLSAACTRMAEPKSQWNSMGRCSIKPATIQSASCRIRFSFRGGLQSCRWTCKERRRAFDILEIRDDFGSLQTYNDLMSHLSISEVAHQVGLRPSAIRYYEGLGILPPAERISGQRRYDRTVLYRL